MNMQQLMQQAQKMQRDITKKQDEINAKLFTGKSEWIEVIFNGKREIQSLKLLIDQPIDKDDQEMLEDMIMLAIKDAFKQIEKETDEKLGQYASMSGLF